MSKKHQATQTVEPQPAGVPAPLPDFDFATVGNPELFANQDLPDGFDVASRFGNPAAENIEELERIEAEQNARAAEKQRAEELLKTSFATIEIPICAGIPPKCFATRRIDAKLSRKQSDNLKRLQLALSLEGATLEGGQCVRTPQDVIRWLCEQIPSANAVEVANGVGG